ncbi:FAD-binding type 2 [Penicillium canariense]|uniref:FAD-binding type 2 n=1 Tax=Penicillium canariense TaxID=189055 RepID=A0A9W9HN99_9EURO|nr:FAD-binding type 2 [Penicillium canariense]KAJ5150353.1 FAD-binding type 2 [Penicillium canariense]
MRPSLLSSFCAFITAVGAVGVKPSAQCKCFPGDACWPSKQEWDGFNSTVRGRLIKTVPLGAPCHAPNYNVSLCAALASQWKYSEVHIGSSSSIQDPIYANQSCDPFTSHTSPCLMGNYVRYAVNVSDPSDVAATLQFAHENNIRLVIRNTAHDYMGRSTGAGALAVWTHNLKSIEIKDWADAKYTGKAIKIGAGIQGFEVSQSLSSHGLVAVTGECPTVGIAGGYTQGGGHSPLSTAYGLSADNTLEFEVVTADGRLVTASPTSSKYADLFFALSGSGAGNYGVVISVTLKAHPEAITSGAGFTLDQPNLDYPAIVNAWHAALPGILDAGGMATYYAQNDTLVVYSITGYNLTQSDMETILAPFIKAVAPLGVILKPNYTQFDTYNEHYDSYYGPLPVGVFGSAGEYLMGGRLLHRDMLQHLGDAINQTLLLGVRVIGQATNVKKFRSEARAVLPQWRDTLVMSSYTLPYSFEVPFSKMTAEQDYITDHIMPIIEKVTPNAGAYINEADFQQPDWQDVFFGQNYARLLAIKRKYDPKGLFWNRIAVGSEGWKTRRDGRLCPV